MALSSRGNPANAQYLRDIENDPTQRMHGNQPGVPTATGGTMSVTTDPSKMGPERFTTTDGPPAASLAPGGERAPAAAGSGWGPYMPQGYNADKIARGHDSPKYQIGKVLSNFDYRQGITPEVLEALNALGIGTFSGSRDKLSVGGNVDPRFGGYNKFDIVKNFAGGGEGWQFGAVDGPSAATSGANGSQVAALRALMQRPSTMTAPSMEGRSAPADDAAAPSVPAPGALPTLNVAALNAIQNPTEQDALRYLLSQGRS